MKFIMIVLAIHFAGEVISNKRKMKDKYQADEKGERVIHPAEFGMRW